MSLFGAMTTAVSGLTAQSAAFTNISDNVANSQTIGFKGIDTAFADYLTSSTATQNQSGAVETTALYQNDVQGTITQSSDPLAMAISGNGFFNVRQKAGTGSETFDPQRCYTREGDFAPDKDGYLVNPSGGFLTGYNIDPVTGLIQTGNLQPIKIDTAQLAAVPSATISYSASLPATETASSSSSSEVTVYDSAGGTHQISLGWTQSTTNPASWTLGVSSPDINGGATFGQANVTFNPNGTIASYAGDGSLVTGSGNQAGGAANLTLKPTLGGTLQPITLSLGTVGAFAGGVTLGTGSSYNLSNLTADGQTVGNYTGVSINSSGNVIASYDNSATRAVAHVPLALFNSPDALQRQNGQMFTATQAAGPVREADVDTSGAGRIVVGSTESSNVDIATDLTKLITAQQAYGANAKMITTADQMMQVTLQLKQ